MEGEGRRSKEAVRNSIRTYGVKVMDPAAIPLRKTKETESKESMSRFSEKSLHSHYETREDCCRSLMNRIPYATLVATIICLVGILIVTTTSQRAAILTKNMIEENMEGRTQLITTVDVILLVLEIITAAVAVMIFIIGALATGDTRSKVYNKWASRIGGRVCCAILMVISMLLFAYWMAMFWITCVLIVMLLLSNFNCTTNFQFYGDKGCVSLDQFAFVFSKVGVNQICERHKVREFCKDFVEKGSVAFITAEVGISLIIFSLVLFLICLSANYARIRAQSKYQELLELRRLDTEIHSSKDRF